MRDYITQQDEIRRALIGKPDSGRFSGKLSRCLTGAIHKRYIQSSLNAASKGAEFPQHVPEWWNWQTRRTQNPVPFGECGFDSHLRHSGTVRGCATGRFLAGRRTADFVPDFVPNHACGCVNLHDGLLAVRDGVVERVITVNARGLVR